LIDYILQHPSKIPFHNVEKIFSNFTVAFASAVQRYYLYIRTDDPYTLKIGTFEKEADAIKFANFLTAKIKL